MNSIVWMVRHVLALPPPPPPPPPSKGNASGPMTDGIDRLLQAGDTTLSDIAKICNVNVGMVSWRKRRLKAKGLL